MSKTEECLKAAFAGESQARNKYTFFAAVARKEGYHYIAKILEETADNERRHAKDHFKLLGGIGDTEANLLAAAEGEHYEHTSMYPEFEQVAREEGNKEAAQLFHMLAKIEKEHEQRFRQLLEMVRAGTVYKREEPVQWRCGVCGWVHDGKEPPKLCPACKHDRGYFEPSDVPLLNAE